MDDSQTISISRHSSASSFYSVKLSRDLTQNMYSYLVILTGGLSEEVKKGTHETRSELQNGDFKGGH